MISTRYILLLVVVGSMLTNLSNGLYLTANEGNVLNGNGKRSYLFDLIKASNSDSENTNTNNLMLDYYYLADKLSIRNKLKKFGRRSNLAKLNLTDL